ncbi:hypothetical protein A2U01_0106895, partial [Trifolium medium]|nr:hypothetical protein [Trifolium medium]
MLQHQVEHSGYTDVTTSGRASGCTDVTTS